MQILDNSVYTYEYCTQTKPSKKAQIHSQIKESGYEHYDHVVNIEADKQYLLFIERGLRRLECEYVYKDSSIEFTLAVAPLECVIECTKCEYGSELLEMILIRAKHEYFVDKANLY